MDKTVRDHVDVEGKWNPWLLSIDYPLIMTLAIWNQHQAENNLEPIILSTASEPTRPFDYAAAGFSVTGGKPVLAVTASAGPVAV